MCISDRVLSFTKLLVLLVGASAQLYKNSKTITEVQTGIGIKYVVNVAKGYIMFIPTSILYNPVYISGKVNYDQLNNSIP